MTQKNCIVPPKMALFFSVICTELEYLASDQRTKVTQRWGLHVITILMVLKSTFRIIIKSLKIPPGIPAWPSMMLQITLILVLFAFPEIVISLGTLTLFVPWQQGGASGRISSHRKSKHYENTLWQSLHFAVKITSNNTTNQWWLCILLNKSLQSTNKNIKEE